MPISRASSTYFDDSSLGVPTNHRASLQPVRVPQHHRVSRPSADSRPPLAVLMEAVYRAWDDVSYRPPRPLPAPREESSLEVRRAAALYCGFLAGLWRFRTPDAS